MQLKEYKELCKEVEQHRINYYVKHEPTISDKEFDDMFKQLKAYEKEFPNHVSPNSPTQTVGNDLEDGFEKTKKRDFPMMSLGNVFDTESLMQWMKKHSNRLEDFVFEYKIDGLAGELKYDNGILIEASTRGNAFVGDIVTNNAKATHNLPNTIEDCNPYTLRGEFVIAKETFKKFNEKSEKKYKNPRNLSSGTLKSHNPKVVMERGLQFVAYHLVENSDNEKTHMDCLYNMRSKGFNIPLYGNYEGEINERSLELIINFFDNERKEFQFEIDGIVIKLNDMTKQKELGYKGSDWEFAIAYKFEQEKTKTILESVTWQNGRNRLSPVANLKPVDLEGTTISNASIHNIDWIRNMGLKIGDTVIIEKAGFIIPQIVDIDKEARTGNEKEIEYPKFCPSCNQPTILDTSKRITQLRCDNPKCDKSFKRKFGYFLGALGIEHIGPGILDKIINAGFIITFTDIFDLNIDHIASLNGMGIHSASKIIKSIAKAKAEATLPKIILCLGIPQLGHSNSEKIAEKVETFENFRNITRKQIEEISGLGQSLCENIELFFKDSYNDELLTMVESHLVNDNNRIYKLEKECDQKSLKLQNKIFVITGKATKSREELTRMVKTNGGIVKNGVTKNTTNVIIGSMEDENYNSNKKKAAIKFNIPIWDEYKLFEELGIELEVTSKRKSIKKSASLNEIF